MTDQPQRRVVCAANQCGEYLVVGVRHFDSLMHQQIRNLPNPPYGWEQGFIDQWGVFMDRYEALEIATAAGQVNTVRPKTNPLDRLFSEDLY